MSRTRLSLSLLTVCMLFAISGCKKSEKPLSKGGETYLSGYTYGEIWRESTIKISFINDVADSAFIGKEAKGEPLSFEPRIKGNAVWLNGRTLEFRPSERLPGGTQYKATLKLNKIVSDPKAEDFQWSFRTIKQHMNVSIAGLQSASIKDIKWQQLTGSIRTADAEFNADLEKVLTATQAGKKLQIKWNHTDSRRTHSFIVDSIQRLDDSSHIELSWEGKPIGVDITDSRIIGIPSLNSFSVVQARPMQDAGSYVELRFSDPLKPKQNLAGLISINEYSNLRFTIDGSIVKVYSNRSFSGTIDLEVQKGIRNTNGNTLKAAFSQTIAFEDVKPRVRFSGTGVIVPTTQGVSVPIEAVNLNAVTISAMEIFEKNVPQFLQVNDLDGSDELHRVGRVVWEKTIPLNRSRTSRNEWVRYGLDLSPLVAQYPTGIFRLTLSFKRQDIEYPCSESTQSQSESSENDSEEESENSYWDNYEESGGESYSDGENPCSNAYYRNNVVFRNIIVSDIGLTAKRGTDSTLVVIASDLKTAQALPGVYIRVLDFQNQEITTGKTNNQGITTLPLSGEPYLVIGTLGKQAGYLRLNSGTSLSLSHFDVSGEEVKNGTKGYLYGERGVWRPGDSLFFTFVLHDPNDRIPDNHPVVIELANPHGQVVKTLSTSQAFHGFYGFKMATKQSDPTGNWTARVKVGGFQLEQPVKIETIMPNRLKIKLDFGKEQLSADDNSLESQLQVQWLHGAVARNLGYKIDMSLNPVPTRFAAYGDYNFDDPVREFTTETNEVASGTTDEEGNDDVNISVDAQNRAPGMLMASFRTRVFEDAGGFSTDRFTLPYYPYKHFIGIAVPKGDKARGMLLTDTNHTIRIVAVDAKGKAAPVKSVIVQFYKIQWRWWWEKGRESLADYESGTSYSAMQTDTVKLTNGQGTWTLRLNYPEWGRYLIRVIDPEGGHCTGAIKYIDWPGWAGRQQKDAGGPGATAHTFASDKSEYNVGETIQLTIPTPKRGNGLVSLESGSGIVSTSWFEANGEQTRYEFTAQPSMAPNVFAFVSLLQPHLQTTNDLPIRLYGVIPISVVDPNTRLKPLVEAPAVLTPGGQAKITVKEQNGTEMGYTLAIVDEGLLDLTRFKTPNPWNEFYKREALGVKTWDLYSYVAGAYGGTLEKMLAIGGDDEASAKGKNKANRFPPMVRFIGPMTLERGQTTVHTIDMPQYVGSVRIMVVGGNQRAFGCAEKQAFVRKPLMILGTLPRVLGPSESVKLPVSVFAMEKDIKNVKVSVQVSGPLAVESERNQQITFKQPGDEIVTFDMKALEGTGVANVTITATSGKEKAEQTIELDVRSPMQRVVKSVDDILEPGKRNKKVLDMPGVAGTNLVTVEVSRMPPLNLGKRLEYLMQYPHGCVEQTTSSVFPQVYLNKLMELSTAQQQKVEKNVKAGIDRLRMFQTSDGGFSYWPGNGSSDEWASNYAGHFLLEAGLAGYTVPVAIIDQWKKYQRSRAYSYTAGSEQSDLTQAYRLYLLALAQSPELSAMNRLKETEKLTSTAKWQLAAAYALAGQPEAGRELVKSAPLTGLNYATPGSTFGSDLRDRAMILEALTLLNMPEKSRGLAEGIANELATNEWMSTQTTAYALVAMARYTGKVHSGAEMKYTVNFNGKEQKVSSKMPLHQTILNPENNIHPTVEVNNTGSLKLWVRYILSGVPEVGTEKDASNRLGVSVKYMDVSEEQEINPEMLEQGTDFMAKVTLKNTGTSSYDNVALNHLFPSGWEIHNERMDPEIGNKESSFDYRDIRDDRVYTYFSLKPGEAKTFRVLLNASYEGKYYLPPIHSELMYDAAVNGMVKGSWIEVIAPGE